MTSIDFNAESDSAAQLPRVSCLMVTADRPNLARRAIRCFVNQTYPNLELVVLDNGKESIEDLLVDLPQDRVVYKKLPWSSETVIGELRNISLSLARGEYIVPHWDDDDWYHPDRVSRQMEPLLNEGFDACTLAGTLVHVHSDEYFDHPFVGLLPNGVPPTVIHKRSSDIRYPELRRTSDTAYINSWRERQYCMLPSEDSYLYVRYSHGDNLWEQDHFLRRMRNTPKDLISYLYHKHVKRDLFRHSRFDLTDEAKDAFQLYLEDSRESGL